MKNALELYNDILFLNYRPWIFGKQSETKFKQLFSEVKKEYYSTQPNYEIDFIKPLSNIRKYYHAIIEHEAIRYLNDLHSEIAEALNQNEKSYIIHFALTKTLSQKIKETAQLIQERNYSPEQFDLSKQNKPTEKSQANESYILHLLKHQLVRLIMEVQDSYTDLLKDEAFTQEEIYYKYFNENAPERSFIIEAEDYPNTKQIIQSKEKEAKPIFNAIREDIRESNKNVYSYSQLVENPSRFAQIEEELYENDLINENYGFTDKYGKKKYLAAFYHQLIRKGYFNKRIFPGNIETKDLFIRKFLDHRYNTYVDKQFRNWDNNQDDLLKFIEKDYWLDKISPC